MLNGILFIIPDSDQMIWIWLAVCIFCIIIETQTANLVSIYFGLGAFVSLFLAILGIGFWYELVVFVIVATGTLLFTRPIALKYMKVNEIRTNVDSMIGKVALVTKAILPNDRGEAKVNGNYWIAVSSDNTTIEADALVDILAIDGAKLIVREHMEE